MGCIWSVPRQVRAARSEPVNIGMITNAGGQMVTAPPHTPWLAPAVPNGRLHVSTRLRGYWPGCPLATTLTACDEQLCLRLTSRDCAFPPCFSRRPSSGLTIAPSVCSCRPAAARRRVSRTATTCMRTALQHRRPTTRRHPPFKTESPRPPSTIRKRRKTRISPRERKSRRC